jgi:hypothetical protein
MSIETFRGWIPTVFCTTENEKTDVAEHPKVFDQSAYSSTNPPAEPSCSSSSHPAYIFIIRLGLGKTGDILAKVQ